MCAMTKRRETKTLFLDIFYRYEKVDSDAFRHSHSSTLSIL